MDRSKIPGWGRKGYSTPEEAYDDEGEYGSKKKKKKQTRSGAYTPRKKRGYLKKIEQVFD